MCVFFRSPRKKPVPGFKEEPVLNLSPESWRHLYRSRRVSGARQCDTKIMSLHTVNCCYTNKNMPFEAQSFFYNIVSHFNSSCTKFLLPFSV